MKPKFGAIIRLCVRIGDLNDIARERNTRNKRDRRDENRRDGSGEFRTAIHVGLVTRDSRRPTHFLIKVKAIRPILDSDWAR
jgi:hypothetical protein